MSILHDNALSKAGELFADDDKEASGGLCGACGHASCDQHSTPPKPSASLTKPKTPSLAQLHHQDLDHLSSIHLERKQSANNVLQASAPGFARSKPTFRIKEPMTVIQHAECLKDGLI